MLNQPSIYPYKTLKILQNKKPNNPIQILRVIRGGMEG
jgi:hypothetical protein